MNAPPKMPKVLGALSSIIEVDGGRGFIVERQKNRFVLTAAHCLPHLPPCSLMSHGEERTYKHLLGVIGQHAKVWAQCLFADPVSDIAILGSPDYQTFFEQSDQWKTFIQRSNVFRFVGCDSAKPFICSVCEGSSSRA